MQHPQNQPYDVSASAKRILDVVVVGGGPAGMAAAWHLRGRDMLLLEQDARLGGRLRSEARGDYWLNLGAHLLPGPGSTIRKLMEALGLKAIDIPGNKFAIGLDGKLHAPGSAFAIPFTLPLTVRERLSLAFVGVKLMRAVRRWRKAAAPGPAEGAAAARERSARVMSDRSFRDFIGRPAGRIDMLLATAGRRAAVEIDRQSAGVGISLFGAVWGGGSNSLASNLEGGSGRLGAAMAEALGPKVILGANVVEVVEREGHVHVTYESEGSRTTVQCRHAILATPAFVARRIAPEIPAAVARTLAEVQYGPFVSMGIITDETDAMSWDGIYAVTTPGAAFDMLFNHANPLRSATSRRRGGSLMVYVGGGRAEAMNALGETEIRDRFLADIYALLPELRGKVVETQIRKWNPGNACRAPGFDFGPMIDYCAGTDTRIHFAGDYFGAIGTMETAAATGLEAAQRCAAGLPSPNVSFEGRISESR